MKKLLSFDIKADFGMLKKPDTNEPVYLTFNMLHKPALLGILGAIAGMKGFVKNGKLPEYYEKLKDVLVGIMPLHHENGNYKKTVISYTNTTGFANEGEPFDTPNGKVKPGDTLMIAEQTLIAPAYKCFVLLDDTIDEQKQLIESILTYQSAYIPYLGKNEFSLWWENATEVQFSEFNPEGTFKIDSLFIKEETVKESKVEELVFDLLMDTQEGCTYTYFENLPVAYLGAPLFQYEYKSFAFTDWDLKLKNGKDGKLIKLTTENNAIIQLF